MKKLLLLSLLSIANGIYAMEHPYTCKPKQEDTKAVQFLRNAYAFAQAESEIHPIIEKELSKNSPDKWAARRQLNTLITRYYNDFRQSEKNELMNAFSARWAQEYNRVFAQQAVIPKR